jgi:hypothetical protein
VNGSELLISIFRLHLQSLGHPIINDYLYNPEDKKTRYEIDMDRVQSAVQRIRASNRDSARCSIHHNINEDDFWRQNLTSRIGDKAPDCLLCELGHEFEREKALSEQVKIQFNFYALVI